MDENQAGMPRIVRRSPIARTPKLCPRCLAPVSIGSRLGGWLIPQDYYCSKCGYRGYAYLERDESSGLRQQED